jgi:hypothetical protein
LETFKFDFDDFFSCYSIYTIKRIEIDGAFE